MHVRTSSNAFDFNEVMNDYYKEIFHYLRKQTNNTEDAKDLVQDVFMKVYQKKHTYNAKKASLRTWIYRIAHHHAMNYLTRFKNVKPITIDPNTVHATSKEKDALETVIQQEDVTTILSLMQSLLNKKHQKILNLYFFSDLDVSLISEILDIPKKTVYNTINNAIKKIQKALEVNKFE